jgi:predicted dehydrogenase
MNFLIIGLGSMGKRRTRNLISLKQSKIIGYDINPKRRQEFEKKYNLPTLSSLRNINFTNYTALIISTHPSFHLKYIKAAIKNKINCFIEASIVNDDLIIHEIKKIKDNSLVYAPSCTMRYFHMPSTVKKIVKSNSLGKILYVNYHTGQYLPDWHPWENIKDFYVSKKSTGGCREIVPFELNWIIDIFGYPKKVINSYKNKISKIDANIDDIYNFSLLHQKNLLSQITIEVLSRPKATRNLTVVGEKGKIIFNQDENIFKAHMVKKNIDFSIKKLKTEKNYTYPEQPYVNEMNDFINAIKSKNKKPFPTNFKDDLKLLKLLKKIEQKTKTSVS